MTRESGYLVVVHREGSLDSRQFRVPLWVVRAATAAAVIVVLGAVVLAASYGPVVAAAGREPLLRRQVARLTEENRRVNELATALDQAEARYAQLRGMLGADLAPPAQGVAGAHRSDDDQERLPVAPAVLARSPGGDSARPHETGPSVPHLWPLIIPSYRTRGMVAEGSPQEIHPGLDLAVPVGSEVRATGGGIVRDMGQEPSYGMYVLLQHPGGYQSMYGHLSRVVVTRDEEVNAGQLVGLSGNTGRSTAPHLHFEIRRGGRSVDPLTLVREGR